MGLAGMISDSLGFNGQLDLYADNKHDKETDFDIVIKDEGELVIGEGKTIGFIF